jgi:thioesterase domain-containing protein
MFGFARLAGYDYFGHFARAIEQRFDAAGRRTQVRVCEVHPTSSVRRRAAKLVQLIATTCEDDGSIHIIGHSTGGLDARLVASPSVHLGKTADRQLGWIDRLRSVTTVNTPHYGTPLATFFATAKGQQLLYALTALTVTALKLGAPPLTLASALVAALGRTGDALGLELALVDRVTDSVARALDDAASRELRDWLRQVRDDQGGVVQLMPEAMDLFRAGVEDRPGVRYQFVASYAPRGGVRDWLGALRNPWSVASGALFQILYTVTAQHDERYPCAPRDRGAPVFERMLGEVPDQTANDGVVPLTSQVWGEPVWIGRGDHLDVVGHFPGAGGHVDWLCSGSRFDALRFESMMDRIVEGMLRAE